MGDRQLWDVCTSTYFPQRTAIRSEKTISQYRYAVQDFGRFLERIPLVSDLTDEGLTGLLTWLLRRKLAPKTANERVGRLRTLWVWLARRGHILKWPTIERVPEPKRIPVSWTQPQLQRLFWSCSQEDLCVGDLPGHLWWSAWHAIAWNTAERMGAMIELQWNWLDLDSRTLYVPGSVRKGGLSDMIYSLWIETIRMLELIREPPRKLILPWPYHRSSFYHRYDRILERAGLPTDRYSKAHRMRVSHASWVRATTGLPAPNLGHASESTTKRHYEDPRVCRREPPKLFIPWERID